jgi:copper oxidase (laccase) domain-containing protein
MHHFLTLCDNDRASLRILLGPSAKVCCYEVSPDFIGPLQLRGNKTFFDLAACAQQKLHGLGIAPTAINSDYNLCTMCNERFFSHRRQGEKAGRNLTVLGIKKSLMLFFFAFGII